MIPKEWNRPTDFKIDEGKRRIKLVLSYDGSNFSGWQRQQEVRTVQQELEESCEKLFNEQITVFGSGRTDAKVHAFGQVAHFDTKSHAIPPSSIAIALNPMLPKDIKIISSSLVNENFHARFTSLSREYRYFVKQRDDVSPFDYHKVGVVKKFPPIELLNSYAKMVVGIHDFRTFASAHDQSKSTIRDVFNSEFYFQSSNYGGQLLVYKVAANAFLMHQVRSMVGTMLQLGEKNSAPDEFRKILESRKRVQALRTADPWGLYLYRIEHANF